ncbi:Uncharacterised protein [Porphyromonas cangingivalis]|uniref:hypothetical protein n=1 Tax=Porphyromonas cangingivalis TaxID=36874 RepID=UPI000D976666|nr:hypothetical protein [Porphyromonas cangingivalis]SPY35487.1 Uncharacterised protein [Porphyromonas cangingivalis]
MKRQYKLLLLLCATLCLLHACKEENVETFSGDTGVVFKSFGGVDIDNDDFEVNINLFEYFAKQQFGYPLEKFEIPVKLSIEGHTPTKRLRVKVIAQTVKNTEPMKMEIPDVYFEPGKNSTEFKLRILSLDKYDVLMGAKIAIDYAESDVVAGVKGRQDVRLTIIDQAVKTHERARQFTEEDFLDSFEKHLGKYGPVKHRFLVSIPPIQQIPFIDRVVYSHIYPDQKEYGLEGALPEFKKKLAEYNTTHPETPLKEPDGSLVTLPEVTSGNTQE